MNTTYKPRHRRPTNVDAETYARCTCAPGPWRGCPHHYPTEYAEWYAQHKAVA
jgi:hypothetical protein